LFRDRLKHIKLMIAFGTNVFVSRHSVALINRGLEKRQARRNGRLVSNWAVRGRCPRKWRRSGAVEINGFAVVAPGGEVISAVGPFTRKALATAEAPLQFLSGRPNPNVECKVVTLQVTQLSKLILRIWLLARERSHFLSKVRNDPFHKGRARQNHFENL